MICGLLGSSWTLVITFLNNACVPRMDLTKVHVHATQPKRLNSLMKYFYPQFYSKNTASPFSWWVNLLYQLCVFGLQELTLGRCLLKNCTGHVCGFLVCSCLGVCSIGLIASSFLNCNYPQSKKIYNRIKKNDCILRSIWEMYSWPHLNAPTSLWESRSILTGCFRPLERISLWRR